MIIEVQDAVYPIDPNRRMTFVLRLSAEVGTSLDLLCVAASTHQGMTITDESWTCKDKFNILPSQGISSSGADSEYVGWICAHDSLDSLLLVTV